MSAAAVFPFEPAAGWGKVRFGLPEQDAPADEPLYNFDELQWKIGTDRTVLLWKYIRAARGKRRYVKVDLEREAVLCTKDIGYIRTWRRELVNNGYLKADPERRGYYMPLYDNFPSAPRLAGKIEHPNYPPDRRGPGQAEDMHSTESEDDSGERPAEPESAPLQPAEQDTGFDSPFTKLAAPEPAAEPAVSGEVKTEIHFRSGSETRTFRESQFPAPETYCPWDWPCPLLSNNLARSKKLVEIEVKRKQAEQTCLPEHAEVISQWISWQPWGQDGGWGRRGLSDAEVNPFLLKLNEAGYSPVEFVEEMMRQNVTVKAGRQDITGLLIWFISRLPARPKAPGNPPPDRSTPTDG